MFCAVSHDITAAILVFQTNPVGVGLFSYVKNSFCCHKFAWMLAMNEYALNVIKFTIAFKPGLMIG